MGKLQFQDLQNSLQNGTNSSLFKAKKNFFVKKSQTIRQMWDNMMLN